MPAGSVRELKGVGKALGLDARGFESMLGYDKAKTALDFRNSL